MQFILKSLLNKVTDLKKKKIAHIFFGVGYFIYLYYLQGVFA